MGNPQIHILNFDEDGGLHDVLPTLDADTTDIVVFSHGWHEDQNSAAAHYQALADPLTTILEQDPKWKNRKVAFLGLIWPSDKYDSNFQQLFERPEPTVGAAAPDQLLNDELAARARLVAGLLGVDPDDLTSLAVAAAQDLEKRDGFLSFLKTATSKRRDEYADQQTVDEHSDAFDQSGTEFFTAIEHEFSRLATDVVQGAVNPFIEMFDTLRQDGQALALFVLNNAAYNELKIRSGMIGGALAREVLNKPIAAGKRVHLVGHSFGGRLMTAATASANAKLDNLILLEGAYSHNGLSEDVDSGKLGAFKMVIDEKRVAGAIIAGHSKHDDAVWIAYPLASRAYRDTVSLQRARIAISYLTKELFGSPKDRYGAMGANGPQNLEGVVFRTFDGTSSPELGKGTVYALDCSSFVSGHNEVWNKQSALIIAAAMLL